MHKTKKILNKLTQNYIIDNHIEDTFDKTIIKYAAPSLILYTKWILEDAQKRNYDKLYFLMRDGKILMDIANILSPVINSKTETSLIYCSRNSLRQACYHINQDHLDLLFYYLHQRTLTDVMLRLFDPKELLEFKKVSNISEEDFLKPLSQEDLIKMKQQIISNEKALELINKKSKKVFDCCLGYLEDCGIFEKDQKFALVDTGWTGSMLKNLQAIVNTKDKNLVLNEYFYGLHSLPSELKLENCHTFAFKPRKKKGNIGQNNLLECFCGDPSGTTLSFGKIDGKNCPILAKPNHQNQETYKKQQKLILDFAKYLINSIDISTLNNYYALKLIKRICCHPTKEEALALNIYKFNADTTEYSLTTLSIPATFKQLLSMVFLGKILIKLKLMKNESLSIYWFWGTLAMSNIRLKWFLRINRNILRLVLRDTILQA